MKTLKRLTCVFLVFLLLFSLSSCYVISGQKMRRVTGTYKLTHYSRTPAHERKNGQTRAATDYVADERYLYEDYLIVTGSGTGYYVHKAVDEEAYVKVVNLSYQYNSEDSSLVEYVMYTDSANPSTDSGLNRLGVNREHLGYSKPAIDYTEPFTKRQMRTEQISVSWDRVDKATDLSYVEELLGSLKQYDQNAFAARGIYEITEIRDVETGTAVDSEALFCFLVIDPAEGAPRATLHYAAKDAPTETVTEDVTLTRGAEDWTSFTLYADLLLEKSSQWAATTYEFEQGGMHYTLSRVTTSLSEATLASLIEARIPTE